MSVGGTSPNQHEATQPQQSYSNDIIWNTASQLPPHDVIVENMFPPNVSIMKVKVIIGLTIDRSSSINISTPTLAVLINTSTWGRLIGGVKYPARWR
jgi:hypothetical protein